jgi:predicted house-cleaning noncanonical NTP pyrophosphatase (MazG superfamily)
MLNTIGLKGFRTGWYLKLLKGTLRLLNWATSATTKQMNTMQPTPLVDSCTLPITTEDSQCARSISISHLQTDIVSWLQTAYPNRTQQDVLVKFLEEVAELFKNPNDPTEQADLLILLLDLAHFAGMSGEDLLMHGHTKMETNRGRKWKIDPQTGIMSHVRH